MYSQNGVRSPDQVTFQIRNNILLKERNYIYRYLNYSRGYFEGAVGLYWRRRQSAAEQDAGTLKDLHNWKAM
jgi:hypothetical protein